MNHGFSATELRNRNFEQAIEITKRLGIKYIWIDSLCICQAGKDKDFKEEGQYMHQVYQNSFCNIVAADSRDAQGGLFRDRPTDFLSGLSMNESWVMLDKDLWEKELLQSPIYTRGWVFQGRITLAHQDTANGVQRECFLLVLFTSHTLKYSGNVVRQVLAKLYPKVFHSQSLPKQQLIAAGVVDYNEKMPSKEYRPLSLRIRSNRFGRPLFSTIPLVS